ncbi:glycosyltransferase family 4 protein [Marixanthomonas spongiae]|uniref:Glycosyl transferase family 1 n=1 Tax=Marixanthomonas spongiae TaxID=2174845 RepID=A0A2U0HYP0_9FLAO|nr:glycosyltransferase family 4 protein [Marixanthomonas spongiae]PVW13860.1 glycosyl transferase family 1 [Marixanthomonas spongiae]
MKRALIITYYWPPAGGPGVQRWLNFVKYFKEFEIEPVVYVPENPHYPLIDPSFEADVPNEIEVLKQPVNEPYKFAKLLSKKKTSQISSGIISEKKQSAVEKLLLWIRGNFFIPDARVGWVKPSVAFLKNYLSENTVDAIITTGPPHSLHLIGLQLQKDTKLPWLADFRDPWTTIHYHKSLRLTKASEKKHKKLEAEVLQSADLITVTSPTTKKEFQEITQKPIEVITNGYEIKKEITAELDAKFSFVHVGSLLSERNPVLLWEVLSELISEHSDFATDFQLTLAGTTSESVVQSIKQHGLGKNLNLLGYVSHSEALQLQHNAQVLLLLEIDRPETRAIIPGKLFEYLRAERPIVALGPKGSDIEQLISETESGWFFDCSEKDRLKAEILNLYSQYKNHALQVSSKNISQYSRRNLTKRMAEVVKRIVEST